MCPLDDSGGFFRLYPLPEDLIIRRKLQEILNLGTEATNDKILSGVIFLCKVRYIIHHVSVAVLR